MFHHHHRDGVTLPFPGAACSKATYVESILPGLAVSCTALYHLLVCSLSVVAALPVKPVTWQDTHMTRALQVLHDSCY